MDYILTTMDTGDLTNKTFTSVTSPYNDSVTLSVFANSSNVTDGVQGAYQRLYSKEGKIAIVIFLLVSIIVGNSIVLVAVLIPRRRSRMTFFIMHLAIADLLVGAFSILPDLFWTIMEQWYAGEVMCKIVKFLQCIVTYGSTYVLVALSIDRLDAIARPLGFSNSGVRCRILIGCAWMMAALFSIPQVILFKGEVCQAHMEPIEWKVYLTLIAISIFFIPAIVIVACYAAIIAIIQRQNKVLQSVDTKKQEEEKKQLAQKNGFKSVRYPRPLRIRGRETSISSRGIIPQARIRTIKMTIVIVIVFIVCWSPYFIFNMLVVYDHLDVNEKITRILSEVVQSLAPLNSAANPLIYGIFSTRICLQLRRYRWIRNLLDRLDCCLQAKKQGRQLSVQTSECTATQYVDFSNSTFKHDRCNVTGKTGIVKSSESTEMCDLIVSCDKKG